MNDNMQSKRQVLTEIESLLAKRREQTEDLHNYCEFMKRMFLAGSTDN